MLYVELVFLALLLLIVLSIVWSTLRTGISPMMSSGKALRAMLDLASEAVERASVVKANGSDKAPLVDLGSGWGTLVIALALKHPDRQVVGYELSWFPWLISIIRKHCLRLHNLTLYRKDFKQADLNNASILFCYLFPGGMSALYEKLNREVFGNVLVVSNTFALPSIQPSKIVKLDDIYRSPIYVYDWPHNPTRDLA